MKLYVPNPQVWVDFFDRVSRGKASLHQSGRGRRPRIITVAPSTEEKNPVTIKAVLPTEQVAAQAKTALEREAINPKRVEKAFQTLSEPPRGKTKPKSTDHASSNKKRARKTKPQQGQKKRKTETGLLKTSRRRDIFEIN